MGPACAVRRGGEGRQELIAGNVMKAPKVVKHFVMEAAFWIWSVWPG